MTSQRVRDCWPPLELNKSYSNTNILFCRLEVSSNGSVSPGIVDEVLVVFKTRYRLSYRSLDDPLVDFLLGALTASRSGRKTLATTVISRVKDRLGKWVCDFTEFEVLRIVYVLTLLGKITPCRALRRCHQLTF